MSVTTYVPTPAGKFAYLQPFLAMPARLGRALRAQHQMWQARRELRRLDDRLLADIGLDRASIDPVVDALARSFVPGAHR